MASTTDGESFHADVVRTDEQSLLKASFATVTGAPSSQTKVTACCCRSSSIEHS